MLTSYLVKCPHLGCGWFGSLLPRGEPEAWRGYSPSTATVVFECPGCHREWRGRIVGEDIKPLPVEELAHSD